MSNFKCHECGKCFSTERARNQHKRDTHRKHEFTKEGAKAVMESMDDLPDGAFWAMAAEMGLEPEDYLE